MKRVDAWQFWISDFITLVATRKSHRGVKPNRVLPQNRSLGLNAILEPELQDTGIVISFK
jgi:hypothetical protein